MDDDDEPKVWEKLVDKEFRDVFFDIEGGKETPEPNQRERRLDKRREFGLDNNKRKCEKPTYVKNTKLSKSAQCRGREGVKQCSKASWERLPMC